MNPALVALAAWCLGILLPAEAPWEAVGLAGVGLVTWRLTAGRAAPRLRTALLAACLLVISLGWTQLRSPREGRDDAAGLAPMRWLVLTGRVLTDPIATPGGVRFELAPDAMVSPYPQRLGGVLLVRLKASSRPRLGERIRLEGGLYRPEPPMNPGEGSYRDSLARRGMFAVLSARRFTRLEAAPPSFAGVAVAFKEAALLTLSKHLPSKEAALVGSLLLGNGASPLDPEEADRFRDVGLAHVLAASGAQVLIVLGALKWLCRALRLPRRFAVPLAGTGILLYGLMTGMPPSIARAVVMAEANLLAWGLRRRGSRLRPLLFAVWALLLEKPGLIWDLGFLFSVLATYALLDTAPDFQARLSRLPDWVAGAVATSLAALLWVTPLQLAVFGQASAWALPANLLAMGFVEILTVAGAVLVPLATLAYAVGVGGPWLQPPFEILRLLSWAFGRCVEGLHALPGSSLYMIPLGWLGGCSLYVLLVWGIRCSRHGQRRQLAGALTLAIALTLWLGLPRARELAITVLSVGQGDACAIQTPKGRWFLIDAGPAWDGGDAGARTIVPFLRRQGVTRLAGLIITHPHADHMGGARSVLEALPCEEVLENGQSSDEKGHEAFFEAMLKRGVRWRSARAGETLCLEPGVFLDVLAPGRPLLAGTRSDCNNNSVVVRLRYRAFAMLFAGDVEQEAERRLVSDQGSRLRATVLKAAHHGSRYGSTAPFLAAVGARASVVSVGARNTFRHPSPEAMLRLGRFGDVYRTDRDGAVTVRTDGRRYRIEALRGSSMRKDRSRLAPVPG